MKTQNLERPVSLGSGINQDAPTPFFFVGQDTVAEKGPGKADVQIRETPFPGLLHSKIDDGGKSPLQNEFLETIADPGVSEVERVLSDEAQSPRIGFFRFFFKNKN
ncbi:MAG TPA: hypothetical protein PL090_09570 [Syntrophales bacterium]|nr:hypothetical protein [Syntrophales bacterium]